MGVSPDLRQRLRKRLADSPALGWLSPSLEELEMDPMASEKFYELRKVGHEEYSVLSILENVANHDREHAEQIRKTLADT